VDGRILIIDDDPSMLEMLRADLQHRRYEVVTHTSPEAALRQLADDDFGVVLSDISMRGMSGVDLCREVVALREDTPVIVMTAFASIESAVASIRAGAYDFVTKPFDPDDLVLTIERALKQNPTLASAQAALRQADENVAAQRGALLPSISGTYQAQRDRATLAEFGLPGSGGYYYTLNNAQVNVSYTLDAFGGIRRQPGPQ